MNSTRRPKRSATLTKKRRNEPPAREEVVESYVILVVVILRDFPTKNEITIIEPVIMAEIPIAIVQVSTKRTFYVVNLKQSGRASYLSSTETVGGSSAADNVGVLDCEPGLIVVPLILGCLDLLMAL
jgi:hypothetical protein